MSCSRSGLRCRGRFRSGGTIRLARVSVVSSLVLFLQLLSQKDLGEGGVERTRYQNIPVMRHKILNDAVRAVLDIDVTPVYPAVLGLHGGREEIVPRSTHILPARSLRCEPMSVLY